MKATPFPSVSNFSIGLSPYLKSPLPPFSTISPPHPSSVLCRASEVANFLVVREARLVDCWEVADTHCICFFPKFRFPYNHLLRINRAIGTLFTYAIPNGCNKTILVAVIETSDGDALNDYIVGILTLDTIAEFLPRKGPMRHRRTGIAYISNVAVRERYRRKGIAKRLIAEAEAKARSWGCRAIALHSDVNDVGITKLYQGQGFKCVKVPKGANWPQPTSLRVVDFNFMMKLLKPVSKLPFQQEDSVVSNPSTK